MSMKNEKINYEKILKRLQTEEFEAKYWCNTSCGTVTADKTHLMIIDEEISIKREMFKVQGDARFCSKCNNRISDVVLDDKRLVNSYNQYRTKNKLLLPEEILNIREKYELSAKSFAQILGFGDNTIYRYEKGCLQDKVHDALLKQISKPYNFLSHLNESKVNISEKTEKKLRKKIEFLMIEDLKKAVEELTELMKKEEIVTQQAIIPNYNNISMEYNISQPFGLAA
ncbi:MAG: type II toxin-antitoxin system MqsA family antitoxin [Firmicutes bacterium]|nr:type II toxin-antitoxin system MqsA family antitoxin [Bacillota bacterium]